jgi:phage recombination protein Bet
MSKISAFPSPGRDPQSPIVPPIPDIPKQTILDYLAAIGLSSELTEAERTQFVSVCQAFGLNPFKREVYATVYGEGTYRRFSVIVGYETYLKRADRSGKLDGWSSRIEGTGDDMKAIVEIHRRDWSEPLVHEVYFVEAVQRTKAGAPTSFWSKMPRFQLKKVCISQAFRLCFPDELGGLPYTSDELPDVEALAVAPSAPATPSPLSVSQPEAAVSEAASSQDVSSAQDEPSPQPEASAAPSSAAPTIRSLGYQDPYPDEPQSALLDRLTVYLDDNAEAFTDRHREWILSKAQSSRDRHGVLKMLAYSEKVVRNASAVASA